jgi:hypothetical protein
MCYKDSVRQVADLSFPVDSRFVDMGTQTALGGVGRFKILTTRFVFF